MSKGLQFKFAGMPQPEAKPAREIIGQHVCEVCGQRGSFGYGVSYLRNLPGRWRCFSHRMETETKGNPA